MSVQKTKQHSCETTILRPVKDWQMEIDDKKLVGILTMDMIKAFDSLHQKLFIKTLESYNFLKSLRCFILI